MAGRRHISRLFVANRGEIAVRIIRACRSLGIEVYLGVSQADKNSMAAQMADRTIVIGPAQASASYLNPKLVVTAALGSGCNALHPGYGFLAESAELSRLCEESGLWFVGPSAAAIATMGDKVSAREAARKAGVPLVPGTGPLNPDNDLAAQAGELDFPVMLKATAGGGGRGMRLVNAPGQFSEAFQHASAEAQAAFGNPTIYAETFVERGRHIEVQVMGDIFGNVVHLRERDCSVQRRHQKLVEEAPAPGLAEQLRSEICAAAVRLAASTDYVGAGTVEFLVDTQRDAFYFLEMNTRIQVEHPVTEMVTGIDLVAEQIRVAQNLRLSIGQSDVRVEGHAIECRINAEDPARDFAPDPKKVTRWLPPKGEGIRIDTHVFEGYRVPPFYDSLLGKLIVHGADRPEALAKLSAALARFEIEGPATTLSLHRKIIGHSSFIAGAVTTNWLEQEAGVANVA